MRDILKPTDEILETIVAIKAVDPDLILLTNFDTDTEGIALNAFQQLLPELSFALQLRSNAGRPSLRDIDLDGYFNEPEDAIGYGHFRGDGGSVVLSKWPIAIIHDDSLTQWGDVESASPPSDLTDLPLWSRGAWVIRVDHVTTVNITMIAATPAIETRRAGLNRARNRDELIRLSQLLLAYPSHATLGLLNLAPEQAAEWDYPEWPPTLAQYSDEPTARWPDLELRLSYVIPNTGVVAQNSGTYWPPPNGDGYQRAIVWADLLFSP